MTLAEIIAYVDQIRPNAYDKDMKTGWVNEIEHKVYDQVVNKAVGNTTTDPTPYFYDLNAETVLLVEDPHKDVYVTYLLAQMDYANMELERFNADSAMHQAAWDGYAAEYRRNHLPRSYEFTVPPPSFWNP